MTNKVILIVNQKYTYQLLCKWTYGKKYHQQLGEQ